MTGPEQHANTEAFKQWALAEARPDAEWVITRKDARELVVLAERAATLGRDQQRWLAWSGGDYPDDSPGDVVSADLDGTIVLDDGITTWEPKRAAAWFKARADTLERDLFAARQAVLTEGLARDEARAEADRLREALRRAEALAAEWLQDALGGTMEEALAEIRARLADPQTKEQT